MCRVIAQGKVFSPLPSSLIVFIAADGKQQRHLGDGSSLVHWLGDGWASEDDCPHVSITAFLYRVNDG